MPPQSGRTGIATPDPIEQAIQRLQDDPSDLPSFAEIAAVAFAPAGSDRPLGITEAAERTGITAHTLRYYERIGLVQVSRHRNGRRHYDAAAMQRLTFIVRMRSSGMTLAQIKRYLDSDERDHPDATRECLDVLTAHRDQLRRRIAELQLALQISEFKIAHLADHTRIGA